MDKEKEPIIAPLADSAMDNVTGGMGGQPSLQHERSVVSGTEADKWSRIPHPHPRPQPIMEREE